MNKRSKALFLALSVLFVIAAAAPLKKAPPPDPPTRSPQADAQFPRGTMVFYGSQPGMKTADRGRTAGNPFATSFVQILANPDVDLRQFAKDLYEGTRIESLGFQLVDAPSSISPEDWPVARKRDGEKRVALVLVVSDYSKSDGLQTLEGARRDASRVTGALGDAGFQTTLVLDGSKGYLEDQLATFARDAQTADMAIIYTTGHGVEDAAGTHLLMTDFQVSDGAKGLPFRSISLAEIAHAATARTVNLVLYAGCRNNPFQ